MDKRKLCYWNRIFIGVKSSVWKLIVTIFLTYSASWVIIEPIITLMPEANHFLIGVSRYCILILVSVVVGLLRVARRKEISFHFHNNKIVIEFGDLFQQQGLKVIPVSRFMYEIDVVQTSLQGIIIRNYSESSEGIQGVSSYLEKLDKALLNKEYNLIQRRSEHGAEKQYPLGTTTLITHMDQQYLLVAVTETELAGYIPEENCSVRNLWIALESLWLEAPTLLRGQNITVPLLGSGVTGIRLSPSHLLGLNVLAILNAILENGKITTGEIKIVLHPKFLDIIDLDNFQKTWIQSY